MLRIRAHPHTGLPVLCDNDGLWLRNQTKITIVHSAKTDENRIIVEFSIDSCVAIELNEKAIAGR